MSTYQITEPNSEQCFVGIVRKLPIPPNWSEGREKYRAILKVVTPRTTLFLECDFHEYLAYAVQDMKVGTILSVRGNRLSIKPCIVDGRPFGIMKFLPDSVAVLGNLIPEGMQQ